MMRARMRKRTRDPRFLVKLHRALKWTWVLLVIPVEFVPGLKENVNIVILLSLYANMAANWSAERALESQIEAMEGEHGRR